MTPKLTVALAGSSSLAARACGALLLRLCLPAGDQAECKSLKMSHASASRRLIETCLLLAPTMLQAIQEYFADWRQMLHLQVEVWPRPRQVRASQRSIQASPVCFKSFRNSMVWLRGCRVPLKEQDVQGPLRSVLIRESLTVTVNDGHADTTKCCLRTPQCGNAVRLLDNCVCTGSIAPQAVQQR